MLEVRLKATLESVHGGSGRLCLVGKLSSVVMFLFFSCFSSHRRVFVFILFVLSACQADMAFRPGFKEACACGRGKIV